MKKKRSFGKRQSIRAFGSDVPVIFADPDPNGLCVKEADGAFLESNNLIMISLKQTGDNKRETLLHELFHLVDFNTADAEFRLAENNIYRMSRSLWAILRDNPGLPEYLWPRKR